MKIEHFKELLKSRRFTSTNSKGQHFTLQFTEVHLFKNNEYLCDYTISDKEGSIEMKFQNLNPNIWTDDFVNVLFICDNHTLIINHNPKSITSKYNVTLTGE